MLIEYLRLRLTETFWYSEVFQVWLSSSLANERRVFNFLKPLVELRLELCLVTVHLALIRE